MTTIYGVRLPNMNKLGKSMTGQVRNKRMGAKKVFCFTAQDIADAIGRSPVTVRRAMKAGKLDPRELRSLAEFVVFNNTGEKK